MKKWFLLLCCLGFGVYWVSNLVLWYPWSYSAALGMTLMLTLSPVIWAYTTYIGLITYPHNSKMKSGGIIALVFLVLAVVMDYLFFGLIRNAMEDLYHPTTFYGYGFVISLPFILIALLRGRIDKNKREINTRDFTLSLAVGLLSLAILTGIILME